jgi:transposase
VDPGERGNSGQTRRQCYTPEARTVPELEAEISRLRQALSEAHLERDLLKKATAYFAKELLPGTRL